MKLQYTPEAVRDLKRLHDIIEPENSLAARKIAIEIQEAARRPKTFPKIGLPVSNAPTPDILRDLYIGHYTIRYLISDSDSIQVLRIWHNKESEKDKDDE